MQQSNGSIINYTYMYVDECPVFMREEREREEVKGRERRGKGGRGGEREGEEVKGRERRGKGGRGGEREGEEVKGRERRGETFNE